MGEKVFRLAVSVQIIYFSLSILLFYLFYYQTNDFLIFYESGRVFITDIENLYDQANYLWDFRYFPLSALFFVPFSLIDFGIAYIIFNSFNLILNFVICLLIYKIAKLVRGEDHEKDDKRLILYISFYLMGVPHILNYIYGQINLYITFFILISLLIFLMYEENSWQLIGSVILGISIIIKPTSLLLVPFMLLVHLDLEKRKLKIDFSKSIIRIIGAILPVLSNFVLFFVFPKLWGGFLSTNFTGSNPIALNFSFSLTKLITNFCFLLNIPFNQLTVLLASVGIIGGLGFLIFVLRRRNQNSILYGYSIGMLVMLLTYYDSWNHHLLNLIPLVMIVIFTLPRHSSLLNYVKPSLFFFNFFDLIFVGIWYLTYPIFPFNFVGTFFLFTTLYGISKYLIVKKLESVKGGES
ncbi:MAG: glycosyltransferase family 87 protein [Candidatus Hermodarchaeota archaeon]